ncbi:MAG: hypothetical protein AB1728_08775, partial [Bacteroidota bacterium]
AFVNGKQSGIKFTFVDSSKSEKLFGRRIAAGLNRMKANPQVFFDKLKEYRPKIIFLLLPVFALLLKLVYVRSKALYIKHLVFAFYFHAFVFFVLFCVDLMELSNIEILDSTSSLLLIAIPVHLYYGMKNVYQQSILKTVMKLFLVSTTYLLLFLIAFWIAMLTVLFTLYS